MLKVLLFSQCLIAAVVVLCPGDVAGQFITALPTCPGDTFTFRCTVTGDMMGETTWRVSRSSECPLQHRSSSSSICGPSNAFTARPGTGFETNATSFTSTLDGTATSELNGILVECFNGTASNRDPRNRVGGDTLQILGSPSVSTLSCVDLSEDGSGAVNVTVSWTLSGGDSADFYLISITTNTTKALYEGLLNITGTVTQHELTDFMAGYEYNITVRGVNCGSQEGRENEPLTIRPQVPTVPTHLNVCAVYDMVNETLQIIESSWNEVDAVTISEDCANGRDIRASYELSYTTESGTLITTCVVNGTECSNDTCHHELQDNTADSRCQPPLSKFSGEIVTLSVTARNTVGRSNPAVSRSINVTNVHQLNVSVDNSIVKCIFHLHGYHCTITYGTDMSYTNLVHRDTASTQDQMTTILLSQRLAEDTFYIVSAVSTSQCVRVRGRFKTDATDVTDQIGSIVAGGVVGGILPVVIILVILVVLFCVWKYCKKKEKRQEKELKETENHQLKETENQQEVDSPVLLEKSIIEAIERGVKPTIERWIQEDGTRVNTCKGGSANYRYFAVANGTALHWAVHYGQLEIAKVLLENGADPFEKARGDETVLHWACKTKICNKDLFQLLLDHKKSRSKGASPLVNIPDGAQRRTSLHYACCDGNKECMEQLLLAGADLDARDIYEATPKDLLDERGQAYQELVALLDKHRLQRINVRVEDDSGDVLDEVQVGPHDAQDKVTQLKQHVIEAIKNGEKSTIEKWLQSEGTKVNECRGGRAFPRHYAVANGTALHWAVYYGQLGITQLLLDNGADSHRRAEGGETVLHWACQSNIMSKELLNILFDIHVKTEHHGEPLVNVPDRARGVTPLHFACSDNNKELVALLLEAGADPGARDHYDATPKDRLSKDEHINNYREIATLLDKYCHKHTNGASHSSPEIVMVRNEVKYQPKEENEK